MQVKRKVNVTCIRLPLADATVGTAPCWVPPAKVLVLLGVLADELFVHLNTETGTRQELDSATFDGKDLGVLHVGKEIKVASVVVHLPRHLANKEVLASQP
jgi:hypothetical protein